MLPRSRRIVSAVGAVFLGTCLIAACSSASPAKTGSGGAGGTIQNFTVGFASPVTTLNYDASNGGYLLGGLALEPLLIDGPSGKLEPWLAQSWKQVNPTTYVYNLRHGVKFTDGSPLTAADVVFSWNFYRKAGSLNAYNFPSTLKSITATGPYTVQVSLTAPDSAWAVVPAGSLGIFSKKFYEAHQSTFGRPGTGVVGTGPWIFTSYNGTSSAELKANPHWWHGAVPIKNVSVKFFSSETSEALAFRDHEIDMAFPGDNTTFASTSGAKLISVPGYSQQFYFLMNTLQKPFDDIHVRQAIAYALNRSALISAYGGYATPVYQFLTEGLLENVGSKASVDKVLQSVPTYHYDLAKAKAEMAESRYPNGATATISVAPGDGVYANVSQAIAAELAKIGIHLKLDVMTVDAQTANLTAGNRASILSTFTYNGATSRDPGEAFDFSIGTSNEKAGDWNSTNWSTPEVDKLRNEGFATSDNATRLKIYGQMDTAFANGEPFVPLFNADATLALASGYSWPTYNGYFYNLGPWLIDVKASS